MNQEKERFSSLDNALRLLELFSIEESEFATKEVAQKLNIANSTAHRLLTTLEESGFVVKDFKTNRFRLGVSILSLSTVITSNMKLYQLSKDPLKQISLKTKETAFIAVKQGNHVYYINKVESEYSSFGFLAHKGNKLPLHCTTSGKLLLANLTQDEIINYIDSHCLDSNIFALLKKIRTQNYALSIDEQYIDVTSISVPIIHVSGKVIAALEVTGPSERLSRENLPFIIKQVKKAGEDISLNLKRVP